MQDSISTQAQIVEANAGPGRRLGQPGVMDAAQIPIIDQFCVLSFQGREGMQTLAVERWVSVEGLWRLI